MGEDVKVIISIQRHGSKGPGKQFLLAKGEQLALGRSQDCDISVEIRGVSTKHALLRAEAAEGGGLQVVLEDASTNGTGVGVKEGKPWKRLHKGETQVLGYFSQILVPLNWKSKDNSAVFFVFVFGEDLPDARDDRLGTGRWRYHSRLGEGALGTVYRGSDESGVLPDEVAIKVAKAQPQAKPGSRIRSAYILHREAQWSLQRLHNAQHPEHCPKRSKLFVRYVEDHTGHWPAPAAGFESERGVYEAQGFCWDKFEQQAQLPTRPYVVMDLVRGRTLHNVMGWGSEPAVDPPLAGGEKLEIARQSAEALLYLSRFGLVHRDFRTTNLMFTGRGAAGAIHVIDLGHTISAEVCQVRNKSPVVRCNWRESKGKTFDWAPAEVKDGAGLNFSFPVYAFDVFSLAVLALQLECGSPSAARQAAVAFAEERRTRRACRFAAGIKEDLLRRMLGEPERRPKPGEVLQALQKPSSSQREGSRSRSRSPPLREFRLTPPTPDEDEVETQCGEEEGERAALFGTPTEP